MVLFPFQGSLSPRLPQSWKGSELHVWQLGDCRGRGGGNTDGGPTLPGRRTCRQKHRIRGGPKPAQRWHYRALSGTALVPSPNRLGVVLYTTAFPKTAEGKIKMYRDFRPSISLSSGGGGGERDVPNGWLQVVNKIFQETLKFYL